MIIQTKSSPQQRAVLVAVDFGRPGEWSLKDRLDELAELAASAGVEVVHSVWQQRRQADAAFFIGPGKVEEVAQACRQLDAGIVIFDHDLLPAQLRNLERRLDLIVIDRTQLILDIFAQRAQTREGKLQVELAQLRYLLPRLAGRGAQLSRLGAGIGTRGPGETKLETDRRRIRRRIKDLTEALDKVKQDRRLRRKSRVSPSLPLIALVGYTNAGKSTLLKSLTGADTYIADQLFATLDPKTNRVELPGNVTALVTDTVGFIHGLPHQLVAAFRATLEHVVDADILLHVVDASHPQRDETIVAVNQVLKDLGVAHKQRVTVLNKADRLTTRQLMEIQSPAMQDLPNPVLVSALHGTGLDELKQVVADLLAANRENVELTIPYDQMELLEIIHNNGLVTSTSYEDDGVHIKAVMHPVAADHVRSRLNRRERV